MAKQEALFTGVTMNTVEGITAPVKLRSEMNRDAVIMRLNQLGDVFTLALRSVTDETAFENTAGFEAEMIPHTVNGYQRFLDDISQSSAGSIIAGFVIRFKQLLLIEFGDYVVSALENELVTLSPIDIMAAEKGEGPNEKTLWKIAHPNNPDLAPPTEYDLLSAFLLLMQMKNLIIRAGAQQQQIQNDRDAERNSRGGSKK